MPPLIRFSSLPSISTTSTPWDSDTDSYETSSTCSSDCSFDDEIVNRRIKPYWPKYRVLFESRGYRLDTVRDARAYYRRVNKSSEQFLFHNSISSILCSEEGSLNDDDLCPDAGLPDNLFRGVKTCSGKKIVTKAVHSSSREYEIVQLLSSPALRDDPMNHTIPVLDLFECAEDQVAFIVMEEWSSQLIPDSGGPCCLKFFLGAIRQCIEHAAFMHKHQLAHLDISLRNLVTDFKGHYAYIDFELSRNFQGIPCPRIYNHRATEMPPECEDRGGYDPYKIDIWTLGVLLLRASQMLGFDIPELLLLTGPMLDNSPDCRPPLEDCLREFDGMISRIKDRIHHDCGNTND